MTEDETYRKLRKPSFKDMVDKVDSFPDLEWSNLPDAAIDNWFENWDWTYKEYVMEFHIYLRSRSGQ